MHIGVIGLDHGHILAMTRAVLDAGAELVSFVRQDHALGRHFGESHPDARSVSDPKAVLEDDSIELVLCAAVPNKRAAIGEAALRHGKDFLSDKPGFTSPDQLTRAFFCLSLLPMLSIAQRRR